MGVSSKHVSGDWMSPARAGFAVVALTFGVAGGWSAFAVIDSAVVAGGTVAVETERKAVQHLEGGMVREILVAEGDRVVEGQTLVRIDPTQSRAQADMARNAVATALAEEARLSAELEGRPEVAFPAEVQDAATRPDVRRAVDDQVRQFRERRRARDNEVAVLEERIAQAEQQKRSTEAQLASGRAQIASITEEYNKLKPVADRGLIPVTRITTLDRSRTDMVGRVGSMEADVMRLDRTIQETRYQVDGVARKFAEDASAKVSETRAKLSDAREKLKVAEDVLARAAVASPRTGRVVGLKVHGAGAVVRPGDTIMEVVPEDDTLVVTARMSPLDVNHVHPGLDAEIRLPSFKSRTTPIALGKVEGVGADALKDETTRQPYYDLRVSVHVKEFPQEVRDKLRPGMPAEVFVATGTRTVLAYLLQPMADAMRRGMREH